MKILTGMDALRENLKQVDTKIETYSSPIAVEFINQLRKLVEDEKRENNLI